MTYWAQKYCLYGWYIYQPHLFYLVANACTKIRLGTNRAHFPYPVTFVNWCVLLAIHWGNLLPQFLSWCFEATKEKENV